MGPPVARLPRHARPVAVALLAFLAFTAVHFTVFRPALGRYRAAVHEAATLGVPPDPGQTPQPASPRLLALVETNSLDAAVAEERGSSGALTAGLLSRMSRLADARGLDIIATEQGLVTQLPASVQVRAFLRLRGDYAAFTRFLGGLAGSDALCAVERFSLRQDAEGQPPVLEVWVSQSFLKRRGPR